MNLDQMSAALAQADLRVLVMSLFHVTGEERWLNPPYAPQRDVKLIADEDAGFSEPVQDEIRQAALQALKAKPNPAITDPGDELMIRMMSHCLGEAVPPEYAPMMREQLGFVSQTHNLPVIDSTSLTSPVVIIGAGVSGIALGKLLLEQNVDFVILERNDDLGGTWLENVYPGCGVDTPNHAYSFSFMPPYKWSSYFSPQSDLLAYMRHTVDHLGLRKYMRFNHAVTSANWDASRNLWQVEAQTPNGLQVIETPALVHGTGQFAEPVIANIKGRDDFAGTLFHSSRWPKGLSLKGKRVGIIGTGATAMQIVPTVAVDVQQITVFQRSAQWARPIPRYHDRITDNQQFLLDHAPFYAAWFRFTMLWRYGDGLLPYLKIDPDWQHAARSVNRANDRHRQQMADHICGVLQDRPDLIEKCLPDYPPYGKRILLDNGWFEALLKPNVALVTDAIDHIEPRGVVDGAGALHEFDVLIFATGFDVTDMTTGINIVGTKGQSLREFWQDDNPSAYLGITVPDFPNYFRMLGPNTGLGHGGSAIGQSEAQARYIAACIAEIANNGRPLEVLQQAHDEYVARVDAEHQTLIWAHPGMSTYYRNRHGRVYSVMPWRIVDYWHMMRGPDLQHFKRA